MSAEFDGDAHQGDASKGMAAAGGLEETATPVAGGHDLGSTSELLPPSRRTFLKAAVLGAGAAAVGNQFQPIAAYAHSDSGVLGELNCTANDVRIVGPGIILNEPCTCTGTFNAQVQFTIENRCS